jgi:deoxyadenosine/deoxycytidine kinase
MGKLIVVVGNSGVGKTALVKSLCANNKHGTGLEEHVGRPFQTLFKTDHRYALANQVDYLLLRAEQERFIRQGLKSGIQDGGLEMDFQVFTRLFLYKGFLSMQEFSICERLYDQIRSAQPPPEVIIWMQAPLDVVTARFALRGRALEIAERDDLKAIDELLQDWLMTLDPKKLIHLDASKEDPSYEGCLPGLLVQLKSFGLAGN